MSIGFGEAFIELQGVCLQFLVDLHELEALDSVLHGGQEFFPNPGLGQETKDFALVDGVDYPSGPV